MLNRVALMGRLTRDPELRHTQTQLPVTTFTLACDRRFGKTEEKTADFFDVVCWRGDAEFAAKWFYKGMMVAVSGRLQQRQWTDKEGNKRSTVEIVADELHFAEPKRPDSPGPREIGGGGYSGGSSYSAPREPRQDRQGGYAAPPLPAAGASGFQDFSDDEEELPF
jgi:single-strand DNA-binding protein